MKKCKYCGKSHNGMTVIPSCVDVLVENLTAALSSANDMCRSAYQIAERSGQETNWEAFKTQLHKSLVEQHKVMYPSQKYEK